MAFKSNIHYPCPVLSNQKDDYINASFDVDITNKNNSFKIKTTLIQPDINNLISIGKAIAAVSFECKKTYYKETFNIDIDIENNITLNNKHISGKVEIQIFIYSKDRCNINTKNLHDDYKYISENEIIINKANILAFSDLFSIEMSNENSFINHNIFELNKTKHTGISVDMECDVISIMVNEKIHQKILEMIAGDRSTQAVLLNSFYLPVIMEVMYNIYIDRNAYENKNWFEIFSKGCLSKGIDINNLNPYQDAQKILNDSYLFLLD